MKKSIHFSVFALIFLAFICMAATPIKDLVLQSNMNAGGYRITNLLTPVNSNDAANKSYVDAHTNSGGITNLFSTNTNGLVPASGTNILNFLRGDGTWQAASGVVTNLSLSYLSTNGATSTNYFIGFNGTNWYATTNPVNYIYSNITNNVFTNITNTVFTNSTNYVYTNITNTVYTNTTNYVNTTNTLTNSQNTLWNVPTNNGFVLGQVLGNSNGTWISPDAATNHYNEPFGIVLSTNSTNTVLVTEGALNWPSHGFAVGSTLFLGSSSGTLQTNDPGLGYISQPVAYVADSNNILVHHFRGIANVIGTGGSGITNLVVSSPLTGGTISTAGTVGLGQVPSTNISTNGASINNVLQFNGTNWIPGTAVLSGGGTSGILNIAAIQKAGAGTNAVFCSSNNVNYFLQASASNTYLGYDGTNLGFTTPSGSGITASCFSATMSANQAVSTTTLAAFNTTSQNDGSYFATSTNTWTPPSGKISVSAAIAYSNNLTAGNTYGLAIYKNGSAFKYGGVPVGLINASANPNITFQDVANGTDYYQVYITPSSSTTVLTNFPNAFMSTYFTGISYH